jgi:hypothetical protein
LENVVKMTELLKSDWQETNVELFKHIDGYEILEVDKEIGSVDFLAEQDDKKKLLRVVVGDKFFASGANVKTIDETIRVVDEEKYDKAFVMANEFTSSSIDRIRNDDRLKMISPNDSYFSTMEVLIAIQELTKQHCISSCGSLPSKKEDCKGFVDGKYNCEVRRISDDADFHARLNWLHLVRNDFLRLLEVPL